MYCVLYKPFTTIMFWESDAGERTLVLSCSTLHRDTFVSMFWCFYCRLRGTWQAEGFVDMIFLSKGWWLHWNYRVKRPPIRHCILHSSCRKRLSSHASYCLEPQRDMTPDDVMTKQHFFFLFLIIFDCYWKDERKLEPAVVIAMSVHWILPSVWSESALRWHSVWKSQHWWSMFSEHRRSCMHFIGVCQSIITW